MVLTITRKKRPRRKAGERANLTAEKITGAALEVLDRDGLENFSGRAVAKLLGVTPAAIYAHVKGGLAEIKARMVQETLAEAVAPYTPADTPARYMRELFLNVLKAVHGKQPIAQLVAIELSADYLVCPMLIDRLLAVCLSGSKGALAPAKILDLAMAMLVGMVMIEAETTRDERTLNLSRAFLRRVRALPPHEIPTLSAHVTELLMQIKRRLTPAEVILRGTAHWYCEPVIAALQLAETKKAPA
jgi:TetR/AcrR family tetracycline transcriptional repressor